MAEQTYQQQLVLALNDKLIDTANLFFRTLIIINGGLCVAAMGFASSSDLKSNQNTELLLGLGGAVFTGAMGVALAALAIALGYFANQFLGALYVKPDDNKAEKTFDLFAGLTAAASALSLICFLSACWGMRDAIMTTAAQKNISPTAGALAPSQAPQVGPAAQPQSPQANSAHSP